MKKSVLALSLLTLSGVALASCPDFSGTYQQNPDSCKGRGYKSNRGWPLMEQTNSVVKIEQTGCEKITIAYNNTIYTPPSPTIVEIDLTKAKKLKVDKHGGLKVKFYEPPERVWGLGQTLRASDTDRLYMIQDADGIEIKSSTFMKGFYNYVVPVLDKDSFHCKLQRL